MTPHWSENHDNVLIVARYLVRTEGCSVNHLLDFVEAPWQFDHAWERAQAHLEPEGT